LTPSAFICGIIKSVSFEHRKKISLKYLCPPDRTVAKIERIKEKKSIYYFQVPALYKSSIIFCKAKPQKNMETELAERIH